MTPIIISLQRWFFAGQCLFPFIILRCNEYTSFTELFKTSNHEQIHFKQQAELLVTPAYFLYIFEFIVRLTYYRNFRRAYEMVSFEQEARKNEENVQYLKTRKKFAFYGYLYIW